MKTRFAVILIPIAYVLGCLFPIPQLVPIITKNTQSITYFEYIKLIVDIFMAVFTLCAVVVALLKDEITKLWKSAKFDWNKKN
jgi:hypothetical protein